MTYHLFETEFKRVSSFNTYALLWFSVSSFMLSVAVNLFIAYAFSVPPLTDVAKIVLKFGSLVSVGVFVISFGGGIYSLLAKRNLIKDIKRETVEQS